MKDLQSLRWGWCATLLVLAALPAASAAPGAVVAVVEDVHGSVPGIESMDYVAAGKVIELGPKGGIVLGYLRSCWRETITGGTVTVGEEQSSVRLGQVERAKVACVSSRARLGTRDATQGAATVFRSVRPVVRPASPAASAGSAPAPAPEAVPDGADELPTLHGRQPVFDVGSLRGALVIERVDVPVERFEFTVGGEALSRGRFFDLARTPILLTPGAIYAVSLGSTKLEFEIASDARPGATPVAGRLLRLD